MLCITVLFKDLAHFYINLPHPKWYKYYMMLILSNYSWPHETAKIHLLFTVKFKWCSLQIVLNGEIGMVLHTVTLIG